MRSVYIFYLRRFAPQLCEYSAGVLLLLLRLLLLWKTYFSVGRIYGALCSVAVNRIQVLFKTLFVSNFNHNFIL